MPSFTSMVLKDHAAADHTFSPRDIVGGVATLVNSSGVPVGDKTVSYAITRTSGANRRKVTMKMALPIVQDTTISGVTRPAVVRTAYADVTMTFDQTSSTAERQDALAYLSSLLENTNQIIPLVENLSAPY
uniref:Coat protein n=1 Tax=Leviviridae sp. TaxID=2027243 RepID=A0A514DCE5_9VIRU|nr:MAG: hypothetical protein H4BulkLitter231117_000002 [Leviviridae sp.]